MGDAYKIWQRRIKNSVKVLLGREIAVPFVKDGGTHVCPVCEVRGVDFYPLPMFYNRELFENQCIHPVFQAETINMEYYMCSNCGASDRDRLYALYFNKYLNNNPAGKFKVLDIAPAKALSSFLKRKPQLSIRTADLFMEGVDDVVDITDMNGYEEGVFDIFICSHVLEHIQDDLKAMKELYRVLRKGG